MFCHHHDEAEVYGSDPVPCPFCGLGAPEEPQPGTANEAPGTRDSNEALRHVLFDVEDRSDELQVHW